MGKSLPSADLFDRIIEKINYEQKIRIVKRKLYLYSFGFMASLAVAIPLFQRLWADISRSGFFRFLVLLFSDFGIILFDLKNYFLLLLETAPLVTLSMSLVVLYVLIFISGKIFGFIIELKKLHFIYES